MQRVGKKFRLHDVLQRNAQNDKLGMYKTSLLKTLDKAGMKNEYTRYCQFGRCVSFDGIEGNEWER